MQEKGKHRIISSYWLQTTLPTDTHSHVNNINKTFCFDGIERGVGRVESEEGQNKSET